MPERNAGRRAEQHDGTSRECNARAFAAPALNAAGRPRADRAQQFMPFAALRGYYDLVLQKQRVTEPRRELSEDTAEELSRKLARLERGQMVRVTHYDTDAYIQTIGILTHLDLVERCLTVVKTRIPLDDIVDVEPA